MNAKIKITYKDKDGNIIVDPKEGDLGYSSETEKLYVYTNGQWEIIKGETNLGMSIYDLNKQLIAQLPELTEEQLDDAGNLIKQYVEDQANEFYMLLCRDLNYYTLFRIVDFLSEPMVISEVLGCAEDLGNIKSIEFNDNNAIEIWVHPTDSDPVAMYLFPYDAGVIECTL